MKTVDVCSKVMLLTVLGVGQRMWLEPAFQEEFSFLKTRGSLNKIL